jgi:hypothetical protein
MSSVQQQLLDIMNSLPDDGKLEDFAIGFTFAGESKGLVDIQSARTHTHEELVAMVKSW